MPLPVFLGGWDTRWWQGVDEGAENEEWAMGVREDGKLGVYGDVAVDRSGSGMVNGGWNFSWDKSGVSDEEDAEVGEFMSLVGLADGILSEVVLSADEKSWRAGGDAVNVCNFDEAIGKLTKKNWHFGLKGVSVADSDWDEEDWESVWSERRFDLGKDDGGGGLTNDGCYKYDKDNTIFSKMFQYFFCTKSLKPITTKIFFFYDVKYDRRTQTLMTNRNVCFHTKK